MDRDGKDGKSALSTGLEAEERRVRALAEAHGQGHVFRFWKELAAGERAALLEQLARIDFGLVRRLAGEHVLDAAGPREAAAAGKLEPAPVIRLPATEAERREAAAARARGEEILRAGKVAAFVVAGGQGTRLGFDGPKGTFAIGPVTGRTLFQLHAEKLLAISRRHGRPVPWYIMTAESNHDATTAFFEKHGHFGLPASDVFFFQQEMVPAVDRQGKVLLETRGRVFTSPSGHGGSLLALHKSGALADMRRRGIEHIFYFQVDNPLLVLCDPLFIGRHALAEAEMSSKVVRKTGPEEKVGVYGLRDGKLTVIEYSDLPPAEARATLPDGSLKYWAGSIAIHVLAPEFVERLNQGGFGLPFHRAEKAIPHVNERGEVVKPEDKNGIKFETFVFDALAETRRSVTMEVDRSLEFSPVKNATGVDSVDQARRDVTAMYLRWLEGAGAAVERAADGTFAGHVELSPLAILDEADAARAVKPGTRIRPGFVLAAPGS
jgi:UDP-N-acetylglucosamine/UDP-N-acetylgalactosamine diphosphorylase